MAPEDNVIWDDSSPLTVGSCGIILNTANVEIWKAGYYKVYFNLYHNEPCQFAFFLNNVLVPGTITGSPTGSAQNTNAFIMIIQQADVQINPSTLSPSGFSAFLTLRNHTSYVPLLTLDGQAGSGSAQPQIVTSLVMYLLLEI
jgi:hypothetical protein